MDTSRLTRVGECEWSLEPTGAMRVPGRIFGDDRLVEDMGDEVLQQVANVASLPGIVRASMAMPDAHWGYGFPIGGVAAFDPAQGGVVSAGGVGFDISCGVRAMRTGLTADDLPGRLPPLADALFREIPAGVGRRGALRLSRPRMDDLLAGGARWAVDAGYGEAADLDRIEHGGRVEGADPAAVSDEAKRRQEEEIGTLGSGNHYLEIQVVEDVTDEALAAAFGFRRGDALLSIHCGSRGLGHQVATDYMKSMLRAAARHGIALPDRQLACAPVESDEGRAYLGAMRAAANCALANRQVLGHLARRVLARLAPRAEPALIYDISHNFCSEETHEVDGAPRRLFVHRKGATASRPPGHARLPASLRDAGQPVLIGGSMGTPSFVLAGAPGSAKAFFSALHGAGRSMSRHDATRRWQGRDVVRDLERRGILLRGGSMRGVAEEAPGAYKDVERVVSAAVAAGLARRVARLAPRACVKG